MAKRAAKALALLLLSLSIVLFASPAASAADSGDRDDANSSLSSREAVTQREFDYFAFSLQWPGTYCQRTHHCCSKNGCCRSDPVTVFTIHGLWPDYNDGSYPSCCSKSDFDINKVASLLPDLQKYWPSLSCSSPSLCHGGKGLFWAHEWEKHGTCSYPIIKDEYSYFSAALNLYFKHNVTEILGNDGIFVGNDEKHLVRDIISAIDKAIGALPLLKCKSGSLEEIQLCFDKDLKPRDCVLHSAVGDKDALNSRKYCPRYISLPTYSPLLDRDASSVVSLLAGDKPFIPFSVE